MSGLLSADFARRDLHRRPQHPRERLHLNSYTDWWKNGRGISSRGRRSGVARNGWRGGLQRSHLAVSIGTPGTVDGVRATSPGSWGGSTPPLTGVALDGVPCSPGLVHQCHMAATLCSPSHSGGFPRWNGVQDARPHAPGGGFL